VVGFSSNSKWTVLFDGKTVKGLRGYKQSGFPDSWEVVDGTLKTVPGHGIDLISEEVYSNFELELEWKVPEKGNSGIFYFATEEGDYIWQSAPEMQIVDDEKHTDGKHTLTSAGALYALIAPSANVVKPVGEFNQVRIKVKNNHVEHWLNGQLLLEFEPFSKGWYLKRNSGKWDDYPDYGKFRKGYIALQDHDSPIWFRNIKIRKL